MVNEKKTTKIKLGKPNGRKLKKMKVLPSPRKDIDEEVTKEAKRRQRRKMIRSWYWEGDDDDYNENNNDGVVISDDGRYRDGINWGDLTGDYDDGDGNDDE
jgi:hypothetical protein